jgi:hypothetical protein
MRMNYKQRLYNPSILYLPCAITPITMLSPFVFGCMDDNPYGAKFASSHDDPHILTKIAHKQRLTNHRLQKSVLHLNEICKF